MRIEPLAQAAHPLLVGQLVRELVNNAAKHARAANVWVAVTVQAEHVHDDGIGIPPGGSAVVDGHFGLGLCRARVRQAGGTLHISPISDGGPASPRSCHGQRRAPSARRCPGIPPPSRTIPAVGAPDDLQGGAPLVKAGGPSRAGGAALRPLA